MFGACELERLAEQAGLLASRYAPSPRPRPLDDSSPVILVDHAETEDLDDPTVLNLDRG